ncbi:MAG TPA: hypothetical protein VMP11_16325 [Verrucomicrobiae bacterium]|nr:hypothetical protein [Verrucomicrobiae bacterium]
MLNHCVMRIYNNTFPVNTTNGVTDGAVRVGSDGLEVWPALATLDVRNNIFYDFRTATVGGDQALIYTDTITNTPTSWTFDNNEYRDVAQTNALWNWSGGPGEIGIAMIRNTHRVNRVTSKHCNNLD